MVSSGGYLYICCWTPGLLLEERSWFALMQEDDIAFYFGKLIDEGNARSFSTLMAVK